MATLIPRPRYPDCSQSLAPSEANCCARAWISGRTAGGLLRDGKVAAIADARLARSPAQAEVAARTRSEQLMETKTRIQLSWLEARRGDGRYSLNRAPQGRSS